MIITRQIQEFFHIGMKVYPDMWNDHVFTKLPWDQLEEWQRNWVRRHLHGYAGGYPLVHENDVVVINHYDTGMIPGWYAHSLAYCLPGEGLLAASPSLQRRYWEAFGRVGP
jgi:hypothetical protein